MLNIHTIRLTQKSIRALTELERFQGRWETLETRTTILQTMGDVALHGKTLRTLFDAFRSQPITPAMALHLHRALNRGGEAGLRTDDAPLVFQDEQRVYGRLETAKAGDAQSLFEKLMRWLAQTLDDPGIHPLLTIGVFTGVFYQLCPFTHDNPRTIRQFTTLLMVRAGYSYAPFSLFETPQGVAAEQLFMALGRLKDGLENGTPDWPGWLDYFLTVLVGRKNELARKLERDQTALSTMPALSRQILSLFETRERLGMKEIERLTRGARATLKLRLGELVEGGYLKRHGQARSTWYARV
jgi:Fic family protein